MTTESHSIASTVDTVLRDQLASKGLNYTIFTAALLAEASRVFSVAARLLNRGERIDLVGYLPTIVDKSLSLIPGEGEGREQLLVNNLVGRIAEDLGIPANFIVPGLDTYL